MEKILLFNAEEEKEIKKLADNMKIRLIRVDAENSKKTIDELADMQMSSAEGCRIEGMGSMMVFCGVSDKHRDRMLFGLRQKGIKNILKAVLTVYNSRWTPALLYSELAREHEEMTKKV